MRWDWVVSMVLCFVVAGIITNPKTRREENRIIIIIIIIAITIIIINITIIIIVIIVIIMRLAPAALASVSVSVSVSVVVMSRFTSLDVKDNNPFDLHLPLPRAEDGPPSLAPSLAMSQ